MGRFTATVACVMCIAACEPARDSSVPPRPACRITPGDRSQGAERVPAGAPSRATMGPGKELSPTAETIAAGASGQKLIVSGTVFDAQCRALTGAAVDAWQANAGGSYGPGDGSGGLRCCYLTAQMRTDAEGHYEMLTVMPGSYSGAPPHIHFGVTGPHGGRVLTEIQFAGGEFNRVHPTADPDGGLRVVFDIVLDTV